MSSPEQVSDDSPHEEDGNSETAGTKRPHSSNGEGGDSGDEASGNMQDFELDPDKRREVRKMRRVMANRRSARESRERRKKLLTDLQESVESLTSENATLTKESIALRRELAALIEQSGGASALSMIPNIQSLLQGTQGLGGHTIPSAASLHPTYGAGGSAQDGEQSRAKLP